jgi:hypothetical protein
VEGFVDFREEVIPMVTVFSKPIKNHNSSVKFGSVPIRMTSRLQRIPADPSLPPQLASMPSFNPLSGFQLGQLHASHRGRNKRRTSRLAEAGALAGTDYSCQHIGIAKRVQCRRSTISF